jgi:hypothetical protein
MRRLQPRSITFISAALGTAALTLLLMAPRPAPRAMSPLIPAPRAMSPLIPAVPPAPPPAPPASHPLVQARRPAPRPSTPTPPPPLASFNASVTRTGPTGSTSIRSNASLTNSGNALTATRTDNFSQSINNGNSASFTATRSLTEQPVAGHALQATGTISLSRTVNGQTASASASRTVTETPLMAAEMAAAVLAERARHRELMALRRAELASVATAPVPPMSPYATSAMYMMPGYSGGSYGYGTPYAYPTPSSPGMSSPPAAGVQAAGYEENREKGPTPDEQAVNRLLAASGVTDQEGRLLWPVGLRALPADRDGQLRDRIDTLLTQERQEAATGTVMARLYLDLSAAVDSLRKALLRDRDERYSLTHQAYEDAESYLVRLRQAAKTLADTGAHTPRELRPGKPAGQRMPEAE